jgi:hypothetical protein
MSCKHGNWSPCDECDEEDSAYSKAFEAGRRDAKSKLFDVDTDRFLTDVLTAAGLLYHGKTDKAWAQRVSDGQAKLRDFFDAL